jgi:oleate hydratase
MTIGQARAHLVGGGIASLAAAVLLVRDARWDPKTIHIYEGLDVLGGSLDGSGNAVDGFVIRGGRMFEKHFGCTFDLLQAIPALDNDEISVTDEILRFTRDIRTSSNCRLVVEGQRMEAPSFGLSLKDRWHLLKLSQRSEQSLEGVAIEHCFDPEFFESNFWVMWCTMFAFQRWHSAAEMRRYMRRFMHLLPGFNRLEGIHRTRLNQYDSIVEPIRRWLQAAGVQIHLQTPVADIVFDKHGSAATSIEFAQGTGRQAVSIDREDQVFITLGSMTEDSTLGSMSAAPSSGPSDQAGAWTLWRRLALRSSNFGRPDAFAGETAKTQWLSFTVTLTDSAFFEFMEAFTHNPAGTGGLVTFRNSGWLLSLVLAHQPHFANQPEGVYMFWGYGLHPEQVGDHITKPMLACTGAEILAELAHHLRLGASAADLFRTANCIPCLLPNITTQFMPRQQGDRPAVIPAGVENFAFLGQYVELPDDTVFTVEYSVRSAQVAVYGLCGLERRPTPIYRGFEDPAVVLRAARCIAMNGTA